jgi:hypothetical protein
MGIENPFIRWWITFSIMMIAISTALLGGVGLFVAHSDQTFLSWAILTMFFGASVHLGYKLKCYYGRNLLKKERVKDFKVTEYFIEQCTSLGLLGTIIGLILMVVGAFTDLDVTDQESVKESMLAISSGIGTALVTTLVGLVCALLLRFQLVVSNGKWRA